MSKSALLLTFAGVLLLALLLVTNFGRNLPGFLVGGPHFTESIPSSRPKRIDRRILARHEGESMDRILETLAASGASPSPEARDVTGGDAWHPDAVDARLFASLPPAPLPFPEQIPPQDEAWLRSFVADFNKDAAEKPSAAELRRFHLALAALAVTPDQLPASLRPGAPPELESDTFPIRLLQRETDLEAPFAFGAFGGPGSREIVDRGGARRLRVEDSGELVPMEGVPHAFPGEALIAGDFDNDGFTDLYVARGGGVPDSLLRNLGDGRFADVTIELGLLAFRDTTVAAWIDYDGDGFLDLLVGSRDQPLELYRQSAGGTFQPVAWDLGLWIPRGVRRIEVADLDGDGHPDFHIGVEALADRLFVTRPGANWQDWRFEDLAPAVWGDRHHDAELHFVDVDNDGALDLLVLDLAEGGATPALYHQEGLLAFREVGEAMGLGVVGDALSAGVFDIDQDGFPDLVFGTPLLAVNRVLWNRDGMEFREISAVSGGSYLDAPRRFLALDAEGDGVLDLLSEDETGAVRWLVPTGPLNVSLRLVLSERRPGAVARIVSRDEDWILHESHHLFGHETEAAIGLGGADRIERVEIFVPGDAEPAVTLTEVDLGAPLSIELPKRPRERVHRPVAAGHAESPAGSDL